MAHHIFVHDDGRWSTGETDIAERLVWQPAETLPDVERLAYALLIAGWNDREEMHDVEGVGHLTPCRMTRKSISQKKDQWPIVRAPYNALRVYPAFRKANS